MRVLFPLMVLVSLHSPCHSQEAPRVTEVEGQPLAANVERLKTALDTLGTPLSEATLKALLPAIEKQDAAAVQKAIDSQVLLTVHINPEARVKAQAGPALRRLRQSGYTPFIIKIINESSSKANLNIYSPQAGPVYSGAWLDKRNPKESDSIIKRFAQVEMYTSPPMNKNLSGLKVEYALALLYASEAGKREITLSFDIGQGTQDLAFRGEAALLFDIDPAIAIKLRVRDETGQPTVGRFTFKDEQGHILPPQAKRLRPDLFFQEQIYRGDGDTVLLPPGKFQMTYGRGPEYTQETKPITISSKPGEPAPTIAVELNRWIEPAAFGFYSGDHHIHAAGCAHYTNPSEGIMPEDMFLHVKGEGLNVGCCLTWGPCYDFQRKFFGAAPWAKSEPLTVLKYDVEVSGFGSQALGHVCLLNLRDQTYPGSDGLKTKGWPTWTTPLMKWAKTQGAVTGYAHSANGLNINAEGSTRRLFLAIDKGGKGYFTKEEADAAAWPLPEPFKKLDANSDGQVTEIELRQGTDRQVRQLPNYIIPEMNGIGAQEICVTSALGICDFISAMDTERTPEWNCWYHILNAGFPLKVSGETDFPCITGSRVGQGRVYVHLGPVKSIDFAAFCDGIAKGKSYVSDGYAHCFDLKLGESTLGDTVKMPSPTKQKVTAKVTFAPPVLGTAQGGNIASPNSRQVEMVVNGQVVGSKTIAVDSKLHDVEFDITPSESCWVALRSYPQMHTNPIFIEVAGKPIRASKDSAKWCIGVIEQLWKVRARDIHSSERAEAEKTFKAAIETYRKIAAESK